MAGAGARSSRSSRSGRREGRVLPAVRPLVEELTAEHDVVLWDLGFTHEAGRETLRVALDREGGIDAESLRSFSEELSYRLDEVDAVPGEQRYWLEVTSPGAERRVRTPEQFRICRGRLVRLVFRDGRQPVTGEIRDATEEDVEVATGDGEPIRVAFSDIAQARLEIPGD